MAVREWLRWSRPIESIVRRGLPHLGNLGESTEHVATMDALARYVAVTYQADPDSPVVCVETYVPFDASDRMLDVAGLDSNDAVVVAGEAERANNDAHASAVASHEKLAAVEPSAALWAVPSKQMGHLAVVQPLQSPARDGPYIETDYSLGTSMRDVNPDAPGFTDIYSFTTLRNRLAEQDW